MVICFGNSTSFLPHDPLIFYNIEFIITRSWINLGQFPILNCQSIFHFRGLERRGHWKKSIIIHCHLKLIQVKSIKVYFFLKKKYKILLDKKSIKVLPVPRVYHPCLWLGWHKLAGLVFWLTVTLKIMWNQPVEFSHDLAGRRWQTLAKRNITY